MAIRQNIKCEVFIMCGIPGAGKSTWARTKYPKLPVVSRDIIRAEFGYTKNADEKKILSFDKENKVTDEEYRLIRNYCTNKESFIVDDTCSNPKYRKELIDTLKSYEGIKIIGINIETPIEICIARRNGQIPSDTLKNLFSKRVPISKDEVDELITINGY